VKNEYNEIIINSDSPFILGLIVLNAESNVELTNQAACQCAGIQMIPPT
jgi:hypothetical protein